jgi:hypothetical protein
VFDNVTYADSLKNTFKFFQDSETLEFVQSSKEYSEEPVVVFYQQDYNDPFVALKFDDFDLVISQYAGFVGQAVKLYLKHGGLLVCNDSHGDASMASIDPDYELVAVYTRHRDDDFSITDTDLGKYLIPKKGPPPTQCPDYLTCWA